MRTIEAVKTGVSTTELDVVPVAVTLPEAPSLHTLASDTPEDGQAKPQIETATIEGLVTTTGNGTVIVTSAGMAGSPVTKSVPVVQGTAQVETATIVGDVTGDGDIDVIVTGALVAGTPLTVPVSVSAGVAQVETAQIVGAIETAGNMTVTVTSAITAGSPLDVVVAVDAGVAQVETATIVGTVDPAGAGDIIVTVTGAEVVGSPLAVPVAVANDDTADQVATKVRTALDIVAITNAYTVSGATADIILTANAMEDNDATLNIAYDNDDATGLTPDATSVDTTAGNAIDDAPQCASKCATAMNLVSALTDDFTITSTASGQIVMEALVKVADDATLNIAYANTTCTGLTDDATSTTTVAGVVQDSASTVGGKVRSALGISAITDEYTVSGATTDIILTCDTLTGDDATLNIAYDNGTATGLTPDTTSVDTVAGVAQDTPALIAGKIVAVLIADAVIAHPTTGKFTATADDDDVILTANDNATNDATLNIDVNDGTSVGITDNPTSADTQAGSLGGGATHVTLVGVDENWAEITETVVLSGTVPVSTVGTFRWINTMYISSSVANIGVITATAVTGSTVTCTISAGAGESQQSYFLNTTGIKRFLLQLDYSVVNATSGAITTIKMKTKTAYGAWLTKKTLLVIDSVSDILDFANIDLAPRSMVKLTVVASAGSTDLSTSLLVD